MIICVAMGRIPVMHTPTHLIPSAVLKASLPNIHMMKMEIRPELIHTILMANYQATAF